MLACLTVGLLAGGWSCNSPESTGNSRPTQPKPPADTSSATFRNPLNESGPDPWMTYYEGNYYLAAITWGGPSVGLTMKKAPGIEALKSAGAVQIFQDSDANGVYGPGHNTFFTSPDGTEDWIVYHANDLPTDGCDMGRTTRIQKFTWNTDGTPHFGIPVSTGTALPFPSGEGR